MNLEIEKVERNLNNFRNKRESEILDIMDEYAVDMFTHPYDEPQYLKTNKDAYDFIKDMIRDHFEVWFIKNENNKVIGFMGYSPHRYVNVANIFIVLNKDYREMGIGKELVVMLEEILVDKKYKKIKAETLSSNKSCQHILEHNDFDLEGVMKKEKKLGDKYFDTYTYGKFIGEKYKNDTEKGIEALISELKNIKPDLKIGYEYDKELEVYYIWHNDVDLDINKDDREMLRNLFKKHLRLNFNVAFGYDFNRFNLTKEDAKKLDEVARDIKL